MPLDIARIREQSASSFGKHYHTKAKRDKRTTPKPKAPINYSTRSWFARRNDDEI